jgi:hypothetical protein
MTFDLLRGYFLCGILLNHLQYYPSGLDIFSGRGILYASSAEGFFVLSGIVLGIVRGRKLLNQPFKVGAKLLLKRALQLYIASVVLVLLFTVAGWFFSGNAGLKPGIIPITGDLWQMIRDTLTLNYLYGWTDFLRMYVLFIAAAPLALWLLRKKLWYVVLAASAFIWFIYPSKDATFMMQPWAWQFIFYCGFVIGYYWSEIATWWRSFSPKFRRIVGKTMVAGFLVTALTSALLVFGHSIFGDTSLGLQLQEWHRHIEQYFSKDRLPIPRLLLGALWFWALFWLFRRFESFITKRLGWLLIPFGMNSLYVYIIEGIVVFIIHLIVPPIGDSGVLGGPGLIVFYLGLSLIALAITYVAVRTKFLMKIIPR